MIRDRLWPAVWLTVGSILLAMLSLALGARWACPDLTPLLLCYVALRWPRAIPMLLPMALGLFADLLYGRVPGSGALAMLLVSEGARMARMFAGTRLRWQIEMAVAAAVCAGHALVLAAVGSVALVEIPSFENTLWQALGAALAYPLLWALLHFGLHLRPSELRGVDS